VIWLRAAIFQLAFYLWTALFAVGGLPLLLAPPLWMMRFGTVWSAGSLWLLRLCVGLDYELRGTEHMPPGPVLIAMKHQSAWDTFAAPVIFRHPAMVIKRELGWIPFYGWYALKAGMIPVDRAGGASALKRMVKASGQALAQGRPILIFPEGTRSAVGAKPGYQPGIVALYRQLDIPLVPVAVNSGVFWGRRHFLKRPGRIVVEILPPLSPRLDRRTLLEQLETSIEAATARLVARAVDNSVEKSHALVEETGDK
jgi:1-acyl-sn-glycerol-3-phosphate acyltransferase